MPFALNPPYNTTGCVDNEGTPKVKVIMKATIILTDLWTQSTKSLILNPYFEAERSVIISMANFIIMG